jgi:hypothetical protein
MLSSTPLYRRDGRPQAFAVSTTPQKPRSGHARPPSTHHLEQQATHQDTDHARLPPRPRPGRSCRSRGPHHRHSLPPPRHSPAPTNPQTTPIGRKKFKNSHDRYQPSARKRTFPQPETIVIDTEAVTTGSAPPAPEYAADPADRHLPTIRQPSAGTIAASKTGHEIVPSPATTPDRETKTADVQGG